MGFGFAIDHFMRKEEVLNLSKKLSRSEMTLEKMKEEIHFSHSQLTEILNSRKWKIIKKFSKIFNVFFPHGTKRRKILRIGYEKGIGFVCNKKES